MIGVHGGCDIISCDKISLTYKTPFRILNPRKINFLSLHFAILPSGDFSLNGDLMSAESFKRKLIAILSADVKGYSRLMGEDEEGTIRIHLKERISATLAALALARNIERAVGIFRMVIDQTVRRVIRGEKVPASEKVVSFFEEHTDIIVKGRRDTQYGHKVFLTGGASNLILDCLIERGNPADSDRYQDLLERHKEQFGRAPRQVSADGGFASRNNLAFAKGREVKDAVFAKKRGLTVMEMAKSAWVYKMLRNFRAGIEAGISTLKRAFGLDRCTWSGWGASSSMCGAASSLTICWCWPESYLGRRNL